MLSFFFSDVDCIIHLAASLGVQNTEKNSLDCLDINILGTKKILNVVKKNKIKKFIFPHHLKYTAIKKISFREDYEFRVKSTYALSKITSRILCQIIFKKFNLNCNIVRFFNVYGEDQKKNFVIPKFIDLLSKSKNLLVYGKGDQVRAFCNINDAVLWTLFSSQERKKKSGL